MSDPIPLAGEQLRRVRKARGLTQLEMSKLLKCGAGNYSSMELGLRGIPPSVLHMCEMNGIIIVNPSRWRRDDAD